MKVMKMITPLRLARLQNGYSQQGLALLTDIPQVNLSYAERGHRNALTPEQWTRLAETLEVPLADLLSDS